MDRELLDAAARAAGIPLQWPQDLGGADFLSPRRTDDWQLWNPMKDDGDALRLAIALGIGLEFVRGLLVITSTNRRHEDRRDYGDDLAAATRRAIVHAAAAMAMVEAPTATPR